MFLHAPQDDFVAAEIAARNAEASPTGSRADFRATEILVQNAAATPAMKLPTMLMAGVGVFLFYNFLLKGKT